MLNSNVLYLTLVCESSIWIILLREHLSKTQFKNVSVLLYVGSRKPPEEMFSGVSIVTWDLDNFGNLEDLFGSLYTKDVSFPFAGHAKCLKSRCIKKEGRNWVISRIKTTIDKCKTGPSEKTKKKTQKTAIGVSHTCAKHTVLIWFQLFTDRFKVKSMSYKLLETPIGQRPWHVKRSM